MRIDVPLFKIVQRPLLPVSGSWVDAAPFVIFFVIFAVCPLLLRLPRRAQWARRGSQFLCAFLFVIFLHRCLCVLRGWVFALKTVGRNDVIAFGYLCMFVLLVAFTLSVGRLFCGWVCPLGLFEELLSWPALRRSELPRRRRLLAGYLVLTGICVLVVWLAVLVRPGTQYFSENVAALWGGGLLALLFFALPVERRDAGLKRIKYVSLAFWLFLSVVGVFVTSPWCTLLGDEVDYSSIVALLSALSAAIVLPMAWCRYVCPMGAALGWLARYSPTRVRNSAACTDCGKCAGLCPMGAIQDGAVDQSSCIYCGKCVGTCGFGWVTEPEGRGQAGSGAVVAEGGKPGVRTVLCLGLAAALAAEASPSHYDAGAQPPRPTGWPTFHADNARTGVSGVDMSGPPFARLWTFDLGEHTWKYCQGASVWSACAIGAEVDGVMRVFVGAYDHNVYCLDARSGKETWRFTTGCLINAALAFAQVNGRPMVFAAAADRTFYGLDARTGAKVWNFEVQPWTYTVGESIAGSPMVADIDGRATLLATMWNGDRSPLRTVQIGELFAMDAASGALVWRRKVSSSALTTPMLATVNDRATLFVGSEDGTLYASDARTGRELWSFTTGHRIVAAPVAVRIEGQPAVIVANGFGMVRCLSASGGAQIWQYKTGHEALSTAAALNAGGKWMILLGSSDRCVHAIQAKTGRPLWKFQTGKYVVASPAVANVRGRPMLFVNSLDNALYGLDAETGCEIMSFVSGDMLWPYETRGLCTWSSPSVVKVASDMSVLLFPAYDGRIYAFTDSWRGARREGDAVLSSLDPAPPRATPVMRQNSLTLLFGPPVVGVFLIGIGIGMTFRRRSAARG